MPDEINGLPAHILLIHAVIVLLPLAAIMLVAGVFWPAARRRLGVLTPAVALVALVLVPVTTHAGEWLEHRLGRSKAIAKHADLGGTLLPWAAGIFVMALAVWLLARRYSLTLRPAAPPEAPETVSGGGGATATLVAPAPVTTRLPALPVWATVVVAVLSVVVAVGGVIQLVRIGDSGAQAAWSYVHDLPARNG